MKMRLRVGLLIFTLLIATGSVAQGPVKIKGKFKGSIDNVPISVYKPVAGICNMNLADPNSVVTSQNGSFSVDVVIDQPGFIRLQGEGLPATSFYAEPGGAVEVFFSKDPSGKTRVVYSGSNSDANNLLATNAPLSDLNFLQFGIPKIFQSTSATELMTTVKNEVKTGMKALEKMFSKGKITQGCYNALTRETEQTMVHWINTYLKNFLMPDNELPRVSKLTRDEANKLALLLYKEYDPYDSRYQVATRTYTNQMIKSTLIESGVIPGRSNVTATWAPFASEFNMIISQLSAIDHAPDSVQMTFMGTSLLSALAFKAMSDAELLEVFDVYYTKFPKSPFIAIITDQLPAPSMDEKETIIKSVADIHFLLNKTDSIEVPQFKIVEVKSLQELIKTEFAGRPVFVDFWATWCSPCIAEFQHEPALKRFLETKGINTLYVSIDNETAIKKWEKAVNKHQLAGYHYLAPKEIRNQLNQWFAGIPRYMLFDSRGELKDNNLPKPGSKEELYQRINQLLDGR